MEYRSADAHAGTANALAGLRAAKQVLLDQLRLGRAGMFQAMIRSHVDRLRADNVLTASQADGWWHDRQRQAADGHFLAGAVIFVVAGTRPDGRAGR